MEKNTAKNLLETENMITNTTAIVNITLEEILLASDYDEDDGLADLRKRLTFISNLASTTLETKSSDKWLQMLSYIGIELSYKRGKRVQN